MSQTFPFLTNHPGAINVFKEVCDQLPENCESYFIGGAVRNAMLRRYFGEQMRQRDYDQIITAGSQEYLAYLDSLGFKNGNIVREDQIIKTKGLVPEPVPFGYEYCVVFDMHPVDGTTALENLTQHAGFTINGFALSLRDLSAEDWESKIIHLPSAVEDLKNKQLRLNLDGYKEPANIFACMRFISAGFKQPTHEEIGLLLQELPNLESGRFGRNITKIYEYVGGEAKARAMARELGIVGDLFSEEEVKSGNVTMV